MQYCIMGINQYFFHAINSHSFCGASKRDVRLKYEECDHNYHSFKDLTIKKIRLDAL